jgi:hypothetical protein
MSRRAPACACYAALSMSTSLLLASACALEAPVNAARPELISTTPPSRAGSGGTGGTGGAAAAGSNAIVVRSALNPQLLLNDSCKRTSFVRDLMPTNLLFVVDRSGSMVCNPPPITSSEKCEAEGVRVDPNSPSKWQLTSSALAAAINGLPDTSTVGVSFFSNDNQCGVSSIPNVPIGKAVKPQLSAIQGSLAGITPSGATPLVGATLLAYRYLQSAAESGAITGNSYVVVITDGEQSDKCSDTSFCKDAADCSDLLIREGARASNPDINIRTFVIGVPGSEHGRTVLSRLARAGGTAFSSCEPEQGDCHFDVTREPNLSSALTNALQTIAGRALTCTFDVPKDGPNGADLTRLNVVYTPHEGAARVIPQDLSAPCDRGADGWQFDPETQLIRLCGNTCTAVLNDRGANVTVVLGCPVIGPD